jgi:hypothetical protein
MAGYGDQPMGLRDVKIGPWPTGATVDLPSAIEMTVEDRVVTAELKGDDALQAVSSYAEAATVKFSSGGISLEALAVLTGRTATESGTTPNRTLTMTTSAGAQFGWFRAFGKALGTGIDDIHVKVLKCKLTKFVGGSLKNGEFLMTECEGIAVTDGVTGIYQVVQNETAANLPSS